MVFHCAGGGGKRRLDCVAEVKTYTFDRLVIFAGEKTYALPFSKPVCLTDTPDRRWDWGDPKLREPQRRAIKARRQAINRQLDPQAQRLTVKERTALLDELRVLQNFESGLFGVVHKSTKSFTEYGGRFPTADQIIHNAVIWRCMESGKLHLMLPKLAAMFPDKYAAALADEAKRDPKVRRVVHRMNAGQIKGKYNDPIERLIAENYFQSSRLPKPLCRMSREEAVEQLEEHFQKRITVDKYRRHIKSLFLFSMYS